MCVCVCVCVCVILLLQERVSELERALRDKHKLEVKVQTLQEVRRALSLHLLLPSTLTLSLPPPLTPTIPLLLPSSHPPSLYLSPGELQPQFAAAGAGVGGGGSERRETAVGERAGTAGGGASTGQRKNGGTNRSFVQRECVPL